MRCLPPLLMIPLVLCAQSTNTGGTAASQSGVLATPANMPSAELATVGGQVFNAIEGTPLRKVNIVMTRVNGATVAPGSRSKYSCTTDASGHYSITEIEPGTYRISANRNGFLGMQYNARRPEAAGTPIDLGRGEKKAGVDFRLTPNGVITGKVMDEEGDPMQGVQIQLLRWAYNQGKKQLQMLNGDASNDAGEFRLSSISPGTYYISATYRSLEFRRSISLNLFGTPAEEPPPQDDYVTTFFPNATDASVASPLRIGPGDQVQGINLKLKRVHMVRVSGHLVDNSSLREPSVPGHSEGNVSDFGGTQSASLARPTPAVPRIQLRLHFRDSPGPDGFVNFAQLRADGSFEFPSVAPGAYYLIAVVGRGGRDDATHIVRQALDVGGSNIEGINFSISPGTTVSGHMHYDGDPPAPLPSLTISLQPRELTPLFTPRVAKVDGNGNFRFDDIDLDVYNVSIDTPTGLYVKSLRAGKTDVMSSGLNLANGPANLDVLIGKDPPNVTGLVLGASTQQPIPGATVVLAPREKDRQGVIYFYSVRNSDQQGKFTFPLVPPGNYYAYAWEDVTAGQWFDPEWIKPFESKGEALELKEGSSVNIKLAALPDK